MTPTYRYSLPSPPMPFDLSNNEDHNHHLFNPNIHQPSSSSSSLSYSTLFNQNQVQGRSYSSEPNHIQSDLQVVKFVPSSGSCDHQELKKENRNEAFEPEDNSSMKWMPSKKRIIKRMMEDQRVSDEKFEKDKLLLHVETDNSSNNNGSNNTNMIVRVCSDCHTTKTPLWRSGPAGPKSLCNACGIRQRKARRALAAAASANVENHVAAEKPYVKGKKLQIKRKRSKTDECAPPQMKRKGKIGKGSTSFEDLITSLSNNFASHQVFPQDEKEAAILLMALSYGLLHEFDSL
ncbi:GATA transcription factor 21-like [Vicia villosa]|uniref:GATA transcription factor 21-like n=1 Tax=Vicia villosa TaxID=3911 RepID=UPI00273CA383|nr:GATA transcription factor 21-like [Vicia villosa]